VQYQLVRVAITIAAAFNSLEAVAAAQILVYVVATALYYRELQRFDVLAFGRCAKALVPSALVALAACLVPAIVTFWPGLLERHLVAGFVGAVTGGCIGWLVCVRLIQHPLLHELHRAGSRFLPRTSRIIFG
jgi:hypothetical protein